MLTLLLFLGSAAVIYFACEFFVNGVEWVGRKLGVGETATGTILAAFGTALPESAVTFVAVALGRDAAQKDIGVGAALGGPLVLATVSYAVVGLALLWNRRRLGRANHHIACDCRRLRRDQAWFLSIFAAKIALGLVVFGFKPWLGVLFLLAYAAYLRAELMGEQDQGMEELEPLKLKPQGDPGLYWPLLQTAAALLVIAVASKVFVGQLEAIGLWAGLPAQLVALLLSPVATELPETMNALIWVRQGRERLGQHLRGDDDPGHRAERAGPVLHALAVHARAARGRRDHGAGDRRAAVPVRAPLRRRALADSLARLVRRVHRHRGHGALTMPSSPSAARPSRPVGSRARRRVPGPRRPRLRLTACRQRC